MENPIFIPKLIQNEAGFVDKIKLPAILMDANIVAFSPKISGKIRASADSFIINPVTNFFVENSFIGKKAFKKLPTAPAKPYRVEELLTNEKLRRDELVWKNIEYQINNKANIIIIPYIYSDSINDSKFGINLSMISDALKLLKVNKINIPAYAMINMGSSVLNDFTGLNNLIERYRDDFNDKINGFFMMFDGFDCRKAVDDSLMGLAYLTFYLSENKNTFILNLGDFGDVLCAIGARGYSSSLGGGEIFNVEKLSKETKSRGRNHKIFSYVPEVFDYLNNESLRKIGYKCPCSICDNGIPNGWNNAKAHFLNRKLERMDNLANLNRDQRIDFIKLKIEQAVELISVYNANFALSIKTDFLLRWKNVLEKSRHWSYSKRETEAVDLDKIIEEARKNK
ncbi:MAG: hypothetical protein WC310_02325 [Patescibacteria group bacterium]|jgi:hypothetical protein